MGRTQKNFKDVIITDDENRPMAWDEYSKQLCYCTDSEWIDIPHPVETYSQSKATKLIRKSFEYRAKNNLSPTEYKTMPFVYPIRKKYLFK